MSVDPTEIELGYLGDLVFGKELKAELKKRGVNTVRAIYELSSATTQCANVTGIRDPNGLPCYICGMAIDESDIIKDEKSYINQGLTSECEHVLSIAQAIIFLGLYWDKAQRAEKAGQLFGTPQQALQLEYAWAHRTCNQVKSDDNFIAFNPGTNQFVVNDAKLKSYLSAIYTNKRKDSVNFNTAIRRQFPTAAAFVSARTVPLSEKFKQICNYLNAFEAPAMLNLLGAAKVMEGPMNPIAQELLSTTEKVNNSKLRGLSNAAGAGLAVEQVGDDIKKLLAPTIRTKYEPMINEIAEYYYEMYLYLILYTPADIKQFAIPFVKISLLKSLNRKLEGVGDRQAGNIMKMIANLINQTSSIKPDTMARLADLEDTLKGRMGLAGGKRRRSTRRRRRLSKSLKKK
jgi:hypothetical protein